MTSSTKTMKVILITVCALIILCLVYVNKNIDSKHNVENNSSVSNATVLNFSYNTTTTTFVYNLPLFVTLSEMIESLKNVKATASYLNHRFASKPDETLVQGFTELDMCFKVEYVVPFSKIQLLTLNNNHITELYNNITIKIWPSKTYPLDINLLILKTFVLCDIQVPFQSRVFCSWTNHD